MRRSYNTLLLKDDIGKAKPTARDLPPAEFTYGQPIFKETDGVDKRMNKTWSILTFFFLVVTKWSLHQLSLIG